MDTANEILKGIRDSGLSQSEIARLTGIPQPRISRWENGAFPAGANDILKLAALYQSLVSRQGANDPASQVGEEASHA